MRKPLQELCGRFLDFLAINVGHVKVVISLIGVACVLVVFVQGFVEATPLPLRHHSPQHADVVLCDDIACARAAQLVVQLPENPVGNLIEFLPAFAMDGKPVTKERADNEDGEANGKFIHLMVELCLWFVLGIAVGYGC
jgi:hypothetical protein